MHPIMVDPVELVVRSLEADFGGVFCYHYVGGVADLNAG